MTSKREQLDTVRTLLLLEREEEALEHIEKWLTDVNWIGVNVTPADKEACLETLCFEKIIDMCSFKRFIEELSKRTGMTVGALRDSLFAYHKKYQVPRENAYSKKI